MLNQLKLIAETLLKTDMNDILKGMTREEKAEFVNSTRTLDEVAQAICKTV